MYRVLLCACSMYKVFFAGHKSGIARLPARRVDWETMYMVLGMQ